VILGIIKAAEENLYSLYLFGFSNGARGTCNGQQKPDTFFGESLLLRKLILGIQAQVEELNYENFRTKEAAIISIIDV
jgi:hypothetical protein